MPKITISDLGLLQRMRVKKRLKNGPKSVHWARDAIDRSHLRSGGAQSAIALLRLLVIQCCARVLLVLRTALVASSFVFKLFRREDGRPLARPQLLFLDRYFWKLLFHIKSRLLSIRRSRVGACRNLHVRCRFRHSLAQALIEKRYRKQDHSEHDERDYAVELFERREVYEENLQDSEP